MWKKVRRQRMNLYEINAEIMACVDEETGEIIDTAKLD